MTSWLDIHMIIIYALLALAVWAGIKSITTGHSKSSLFVMGLALGGAGIMILLRWYNGKLIDKANEIQKQRDQLHDEIEKNKKDLEKLKQQDETEREKLKIQIATQDKARQGLEEAGRDMQETINGIKNKYKL